MTKEECDRLVAAQLKEYEMHFPHTNIELFKASLTNVLSVCAMFGAPVERVEFREALRALANLLEVAYSNERIN